MKISHILKKIGFIFEVSEKHDSHCTLSNSAESAVMTCQNNLDCSFIYTHMLSHLY